MLTRDPRIPHTATGVVGHLAVSVADDAQTATVVLALPAVELTAAQCLDAAALLLEAGRALAQRQEAMPVSPGT